MGSRVKSTEELSELFFQLFGKLKIILKVKGFVFFPCYLKKNIGSIVNLQCALVSSFLNTVLLFKTKCYIL